MRIHCRYSGEEFQLRFDRPDTKKATERDCFPKLRVDDGVHPLFQLPTKTLLSLAYNWKQGELNASERRVLFVALLRSTGKVVFRTAARPSDTTVQRYMEQLVKTVNWFQLLNTPALYDVLTEFSINKDTRHLENIDLFFETWEDNKRDYADRYKASHANEKLKLVEDRLRRLLRSPSGDQSRKYRVMLEWAFDAARDTRFDPPKHIKLPEATRDAWMRVFTLTEDIDIYNAPKQTIADMITFFETSLDITGYRMDFAFEVLSRARELQDKSTKGLMYHLGVAEDDEIFKLVPDDVGAGNIKRAAQLAPAREPVKADFGTDLAAFIRAKASWLLHVAEAERAAKQAVSDAAKLRKTEQDEELDALIAAEEAEAAASQQLELDGILSFQEETGSIKARKDSME